MEKSKRRNKKYSPQFKISVILDMREHKLSYSETMRKYFPYLQSGNFYFLKKWERIYLEEGSEGLMVERRGKKSTGRPHKEPILSEDENDLIAQLQQLKERNEWLEMENAYLKKLEALIQAEEQKKKR